MNFKLGKIFVKVEELKEGWEDICQDICQGFCQGICQDIGQGICQNICQDICQGICQGGGVKRGLGRDAARKTRSRGSTNSILWQDDQIILILFHDNFMRLFTLSSWRSWG